MFYRSVGEDVLWGTIPESIFATFQLTFAIITPALVVGTFVERIRLSAVLLFTAAWTLAVYAPVAHWVWGGRMAGRAGVAGLCRRHRSAYHCGNCGAGGHSGAGPTAWLSQRNSSAAQRGAPRSRGPECCGSAGWGSTAVAR